MSQPLEAPAHWTGMLKHVGPGLIVTASIVGSGELIATTKLAGENGFDLLWLVVLGCFLKVFVQVEIGRYTIATGQTALEALDSVPGPRWRVSWIVWAFLLMYVCAISQVGGVVGGVAQTLAAGGMTVSQGWLAMAVSVSVALLLAVGRYRWVELACTVMVVLFTVSVLIAVGALQWTSYAVTGADLGRGFGFHLPENFTTALVVIGLIGVGGSEMVYYPYWCLEKGYAERVGRPDGSEGWARRVRGWMRVLRVDAWFAMVIYTSATVAFYLLGAAVLHAKRLQVTDRGLIDTLAQMFLASLGPWSLWLFLVGAFFVLYSTAFSASASNARIGTDALGLLGVTRYRDDGARRRMVRAFCIGLPLYAAVLFLIWPNPVTLVFVGGVGQGLMLPFLAGAALYFRYRRTDARLRPGMAWTAGLWLASLALAAAGLNQVWQLLAPLVR